MCGDDEDRKDQATEDQPKSDPATEPTKETEAETKSPAPVVDKSEEDAA